MKKQSGKGEAAIFRAHLALLNDAEIFLEVKTQIEAGHSAAWSWQQAIERRAVELKQIENERLAERAADLHDIGQRVLRLLAGAEQTQSKMPEEPVILVADDLTPSDTAQLDPKRILGLCTASGGPTAHTAIIARSLDIPCVVGAGAAALELKSGTVCILDGSCGQIVHRAERGGPRVCEELSSRHRESTQRGIRDSLRTGGTHGRPSRGGGWQYWQGGRGGRRCRVGRRRNRAHANRVSLSRPRDAAVGRRAIRSLHRDDSRAERPSADSSDPGHRR